MNSPVKTRETLSEASIQGVIGRTLSFSIVLVVFLTAVVIILGPAPTYPGNPTMVRDGFSTVVEPSDRMVFAAWLGLLVVLALLVNRWVKRNGALDLSNNARPIQNVLGALALFIAIFALFWLYLPSTATPFVRAIVVGSVLTPVCLWMMNDWRPRQQLIATALFAGALAIFIPIWIQTPQTIRDLYHFPFSVEEIAAPMAGRTPLVDFFPQYSNLLGWPLVPVESFLSVDLSSISLAWLLILQVATLVFSVVLTQSQGDWSLLTPRLLVITAPLVAAQSSWASPMSYFAVMPLRTVLPLATLAIAALLFSRLSLGLYALVVGLLSGVSVLNNPDFSLGLVPAALFAVVVKARRDGHIWRAGFVLIGLVTPALVYDLVNRLLGKTVNWSEFFLSQALFARDGYMAEIMRPFGLHVLMAAVFITCAVLGVVFVWRSEEFTRAFLPLAFAGFWGISCLPYFVNRSLPGTLMLGLIIPFSLAVATLLPALKMGWRLLEAPMGQQAYARWGTLILLVLTVGVLSLWGLAQNPAARIGAISDSRLAQLPAIDESRQALVEIKKDLQTEFVDPGSVVHIVKFSGLLSTSETQSASVVSDPHNFAISDFFVKRQCLDLAAVGPSVVVLEKESLTWFESEEECEFLLDDYLPRYVDANPSWVVLVSEGLRRSAG